jgi:3-hydroxyisobutyrate dehydrogenase-like beta-hydroxyacid dehydrogenase
MDIRKITVVGLGGMGTPIATRLMKAGYQVTGFDVIKKQILNLVPLGLKPAKSVKQSIKGANLVILSLPNWNVIREVAEGKDGLLAGVRRGQIIMDASTVPPLETAAMAKKFAKRGVHWMDTPISGSKAQARVGNMVFMVGGKRAVFEKIKPVLDQVGKRTVYVGSNGSAAMLKLIVNHILFLNQAAAIEGLTLGQKAGIDPDIMLNVLTSGAAASDLIAARGKDMLDGNFEAKGSLLISIKDLSLSLEAAERLGVMLPLGALYYQFMLQAHYNGWDQKDATVVMKIYEQLARTSV